MNTINLLQLTQDQKRNGVWLSGTKGEGEFRQWYFGGQLYKKANYKNGKYNGEYLEWYNNRQLYIKTFYKNNRLHGEYLEQRSNGKLYTKAFYKNGKRISYEYY